jgi:hypothetical protein
MRLFKAYGELLGVIYQQAPVMGDFQISGASKLRRN